MNKAALQGDLQGVETVVGVVGFQAELPEGCQRPPARPRINEVDLIPVEQVAANASHVGNLSGKVGGQLLFHGQAPVLIGEILAVAIDGLGTVQRVLRLDERVNRVGQVRYVV